MNTSRRYGSLFSGYGGLDLAVEQVTGASCAWHVENNPDAARILAHRWPSVPNHGDITAVDWSAVEPVDMLCGGFPCQDISSAGRGAGIVEGTRSGLWFRFADAVRVLRPRLVVVENVSALLVRGLDIVTADLAALGYVGSWVSVRASDVGAPHRRERVFLAAFPADRGRGGWEAGDESGMAGGHGVSAVGGEGIGVAAGSDRPDDRLTLLPTPVVADSVGARNSTARRNPTDKPANIGDTLTDAIWRTVGAPPWAKTNLLPTPRTSDTNGAGEHGTGGIDLRTAIDLLPTPTTEPSTGNGHARNLGGEVNVNRWGRYAEAVARWEHLTRPAPDPTDERGRLDPPFPEWMMGLPDGWVTSPDIGLSRSAQLRAIGNGVVPQQAAAALTHLLALCASEAA